MAASSEEGSVEPGGGHPVTGDSSVRPVGKVFCGTRGRCVVKPGAKVADIDRIIESELERHKPSSVIVQVGVNNIGPRESSKLVSEYHGLLKKLSEARKSAIVTSILPRHWASSEWHSRALAINSSVMEFCLDSGLGGYVDLWEKFFGCNWYYQGDGLHLSRGGKVLGEAYIYTGWGCSRERTCNCTHI